MLLLLAGMPHINNGTGTGKWGFYAHRLINRHAVFTLPPEMSGFYKANLEIITERAVAADQRRYVMPEEGPRHYFDTEAYLRMDPAILSDSWEKVVKQYTLDTLMQHGVLIWHVEKVTAYLTAAFKAGDAAGILRYSADLGHYIADAHVPLHATENYNGQFTGQTGIHAFWESRIPELFAEGYDFLVGRARYIDDIPAAIRRIVYSSYLAADTVLKQEAALSNTYPPDKKYTIELRNRQAANMYSEAFSLDYSEALDHMVERRMRRAILLTGSFWYTAWVNAGQPGLGDSGPAVPAAAGNETEQETPETGGRKMIGRQEY